MITRILQVQEDKQPDGTFRYSGAINSYSEEGHFVDTRAIQASQEEFARAFGDAPLAEEPAAVDETAVGIGDGTDAGDEAAVDPPLAEVDPSLPLPVDAPKVEEPGVGAESETPASKQE